MRFHGQSLRRGRVSLPGHAYLLTTVTHNRRPLFASWQAGHVVAREIHATARLARIDSWAWVLMPDHLHWLIQLNDASLESLMQAFKSRSAILLNRTEASCGQVWQKGYHDRAVRKDEDIRELARYIVANPLRAGLVNRIGDYPWWDAAWL
ncbi:transposase [Stutzerimonas urumqiensis]|uniref:REP-associated tyrosine transposase n=1 Tax=Stutzerimonas urumqiensis TaxID=638269 RepID=UPI003DA50D2E